MIIKTIDKNEPPFLSATGGERQQQQQQQQQHQQSQREDQQRRRRARMVNNSLYLVFLTASIAILLSFRNIVSSVNIAPPSSSSSAAAMADDATKDQPTQLSSTTPTSTTITNRGLNNVRVGAVSPSSSPSTTSSNKRRRRQQQQQQQRRPLLREHKNKKKDAKKETRTTTRTIVTTFVPDGDKPQEQQKQQRALTTSTTTGDKPFLAASTTSVSISTTPATSTIAMMMAPAPPVVSNTKDKKDKEVVVLANTQGKKKIVEEERNSNNMFVVGLMLTDRERYLDAIRAQAQTWLTNIPQDRIFAVGPQSAYVGNKGGGGGRRNPDIIMPRLVPSRCPDRELWCKRLQHIVEAYKMLKSGTDFDWVLSGNEDWYVHLPNMKESLDTKNSNDPVVYSGFGCSQAWEYHKASKNNTLPRPDKGWPIKQQCKALSMYGGICGGDGIVMSRRAIEVIMEDVGGEDALFNLTSSLPFDWVNTHPQGDPVLSCVLYEFSAKGVRMEVKPWGSATYAELLREDAWVNTTMSTVHAVPGPNLTAAEILYNVHNKVQPSSNILPLPASTTTGTAATTSSSSSSVVVVTRPAKKNKSKEDQEVALIKGKKKTEQEEEERNSNTMFVVGLMLTDRERYLDAIRAQAQTWLTNIPQDRIFAVGPQSAYVGKKGGGGGGGRGRWQQQKPGIIMPRLVPSRCPDRELWCKRLQHIVEAYKMLKSGTDFDWVLSGNEDWYVHLPNMKESLDTKNSNDPVVYSGFGCSQAWEYHKASKNNTLPRPDKGWPIKQQCKALSTYGGICGGDGIVMSRRAIEVIMEDVGGEDALFNLTSSLPFDWVNTHPQGDPVLSCVLYEFSAKGVRMEVKPWGSATYAELLREDAWVNTTMSTVHAVPGPNLTAAEILYNVHNKVQPALGSSFRTL